MDWTEQLLAVVFVFLLMGGAIWILGRRGGGTGFTVLRRGAAKPELISSLARMPLTSQHMLHLVKVGDRTVLVATYPGGVVLETPSQPFRVSLASALGQEGGR